MHRYIYLSVSASKFNEVSFAGIMPCCQSFEFISASEWCSVCDCAAEIILSGSSLLVEAEKFSELHFHKLYKLFILNSIYLVQEAHYAWDSHLSAMIFQQCDWHRHTRLF